MKKAAFVILASAILFACGNNKGLSKTKFVPKSDTVKTLGVYAEIPYKTIHYGLMFVIIRNSIRIDSFLNASQVIDTIPYFLPQNDTSGKFKQTLIDAVSFDFNLDSAFRKVSRWVKLNDKYLKIDSTGAMYMKNNKPYFKDNNGKEKEILTEPIKPIKK